MKIFYIAASIIPSRSANSIHVMKMCAALAANNTEVTLIVPRHPDQEKGIEDIFAFYGVEKTFKINRVWWPSIKYGFLFFSFFAALKCWLKKPDIVYGRDITACMFADKLGVETAFEAHGAPYKFNGFRKKLYSNYQVSERLKKFVVISDALKRIYENETRVPKEKFIVKHDASDEHLSITTDYRHDGYDLQVGYVGHLYKGRGIDVIIEMAKACPWAFFHVVGGNQEDIAFWENELVDSQNVKLYGFVAPSETNDIRMSCDVLLAPYQREVTIWQGKGNTVDFMSPLKVFEYMSAGKAILISDLPVLHEVLKDHSSCLFCTPDNNLEWISNLTIIRDDKALMQKLGDQAHLDYKREYSWGSRAEFLISKLF